MKEYECVQVDHHKKIAKKIQEYLVNGWQLHTYQTAANTWSWGDVKHYLLFEKGQQYEPPTQHMVGYQHNPIPTHPPIEASYQTSIDCLLAEELLGVVKPVQLRLLAMLGQKCFRISLKFYKVPLS